MTGDRITPLPPARLRAPDGKRPILPDHPEVDDYARAFCELAINYEAQAQKFTWVPYAVGVNSFGILFLALLVVYHLCFAGHCP